jgi:hypothetical protein
VKLPKLLRKVVEAAQILKRGLDLYLQVREKEVELRDIERRLPDNGCESYYHSHVDAEGYAVCRCGARAIEHRTRIRP